MIQAFDLRGSVTGSNEASKMASSFHGFRALIEHSPDAFSLIDLRGEILHASGSTSRMFGYRPEELVGWNYLDLTHPEDRDRSRRALEEALAKPQDPLQWDVRVRHKDGSYSWVENMVSNLLSESEVQAIVVNQREISVRMAAEAERRRQADQLARQNARLEEFAHTAAHDLREPLRAICSYTEMLVGETQMDADAKRMAGFIVDGAARMSHLIDDLLTFASTGIHAPPERVALHYAVAQATLNLAREIRESARASPSILCRSSTAMSCIWYASSRT